jgi:hypothetical protein
MRLMREELKAKDRRIESAIKLQIEANTRRHADTKKRESIMDFY